MGSFIARRLISGAVLLVVITTLAFLLLYAGGGDIARKIMGDQATQEAVAQKARELGLNRPVLSQYSDCGFCCSEQGPWCWWGMGSQARGK